MKIAIIGFGRVAQNRHVAAIAESSGFDLVAIADAREIEAPAGCRAYRDYQALLADDGIEAVAICTPPDSHYEIARDAILAGKHVLLEKPPTATLGELEALRDLARQQETTLLAAWHSHYNAAVDEARRYLAGRRVARVEAIWHEDVNRTHAGQDWIWEPRGFGVFDPGINAISILTKVLPGRMVVRDAWLLVEPGRQTPIAGRIDFALDDIVAGLTVDIDWRVSVDRREITIGCDDGTVLHISKSGRRLSVDGKVLIDEDNFEYARFYRHFGELIAAGRSDADAEPLRVVADACLAARRER